VLKLSWVHSVQAVQAPLLVRGLTVHPKQAVPVNVVLSLSTHKLQVLVIFEQPEHEVSLMLR
jgi:hypothetical protein